MKQQTLQRALDRLRTARSEYREAMCDYSSALAWIGPGASTLASEQGARVQSARANLMQVEREIFDEDVEGIWQARPDTGRADRDGSGGEVVKREAGHGYPW